jgi:hypothetical protein
MKPPMCRAQAFYALLALLLSSVYIIISTLVNRVLIINTLSTLLDATYDQSR